MTGAALSAWSGAPLLLFHCAATLSMAGLIWFVQVVHYPLLARVGAGAFGAYEREHTRLTGYIVAPAMVAEALGAIGILAVGQGGKAWPLALLGAALLAVIWLSTALVQVPLHRRLERGFDAAAARRLVATNWVRTLAWSTRAVVAVALVSGVMAAAGGASASPSAAPRAAARATR